MLLAGITNGSIYALVALGYTIVYGILELINFAHGDVFTWGAMATYTVAISWIGLDGSQSGFVLFGALLLALICSAIFCAALNMTIERVAYRRLRNAPRLAPLITAIGMSFVLSNLIGVDLRLLVQELQRAPAARARSSTSAIRPTAGTS